MKKALKLFFLFAAILAINSCSEREEPIIPPYDPEVATEISGDIAVKYEAQGTVGTSSNGKEIIFGSTAVINNTRYGLAMTFVFKNKPETGIMTIANKSNAPDSNYAVAAFTIGDGEASRVFISYSGSATLTNIEGTKLYGSFVFSAREEKSAAEIQAGKGILQANQ